MVKAASEQYQVLWRQSLSNLLLGFPTPPTSSLLAKVDMRLKTCRILTKTPFSIKLRRTYNRTLSELHLVDGAPRPIIAQDLQDVPKLSDSDSLQPKIRRRKNRVKLAATTVDIANGTADTVTSPHLTEPSLGLVPGSVSSEAVGSADEPKVDNATVSTFASITPADVPTATTATFPYLLQDSSSPAASDVLSGSQALQNCSASNIAQNLHPIASSGARDLVQDYMLRLPASFRSEWVQGHWRVDKEFLEQEMNEQNLDDYGTTRFDIENYITTLPHIQRTQGVQAMTEQTLVDACSLHEHIAPATTASTDHQAPAAKLYSPLPFMRLGSPFTAEFFMKELGLEVPPRLDSTGVGPVETHQEAPLQHTSHLQPAVYPISHSTGSATLPTRYQAPRRRRTLNSDDRSCPPDVPPTFNDAFLWAYLRHFTPSQRREMFEDGPKDFLMMVLREVEQWHLDQYQTTLLALYAAIKALAATYQHEPQPREQNLQPAQAMTPLASRGIFTSRTFPFASQLSGHLHEKRTGANRLSRRQFQRDPRTEMLGMVSYTEAVRQCQTVRTEMRTLKRKAGFGLHLGERRN
jgi:hypothetical protein